MFKIARDTEAYKRVTAAGFLIKDFSEQFTDDQGQYGKFWIKCACGTDEWGGVQFHDAEGNILGAMKDFLTENNEFDAARFIEVLGAVSPAHLKGDGYDEDQIKIIRKAYESEDSEFDNMLFIQAALLSRAYIDAHYRKIGNGDSWYLPKPQPRERPKMSPAPTRYRPTKVFRTVPYHQELNMKDRYNPRYA